VPDIHERALAQVAERQVGGEGARDDLEIDADPTLVRAAEQPSRRSRSLKPSSTSMPAMPGVMQQS